jgi:hypothetical protein
MKTALVCVHFVALLVAGGETLFLAAWKPTHAHLLSYWVDEDTRAESGVCGRAKYRYEVSGTTYVSTRIDPILDRCETAAFWAVVEAGLGGEQLQIHYFLAVPAWSSVSRYPGPLTSTLFYGLISLYAIALLGTLFLRAVKSAQVIGSDEEGRQRASRRRLVALSVLFVSAAYVPVIRTLEHWLVSAPTMTVKSRLVGLSSRSDGQACLTFQVESADGSGGLRSDLDVCDSRDKYILFRNSQFQLPFGLWAASSGSLQLNHGRLSGSVLLITWYSLLVVLLFGLGSGAGSSRDRR